MPEYLMFQFRSDTVPTPDSAADLFGLDPHEVDSGYGVVKVADDPAGDLYIMMIDARARERVEARLEDQGERDPSVRFFANPRVEPFYPGDG